ncbi:DUF2441 domain-containing protein [Desulfuribacillus alkaliarsenatis]|uniref:Uncharacterized protein n=1 Tax=Desulfuribacillus alkaliarsenatis TaxID=766136 RepID=A0A1E5G517_9FIRM|nr:DUF2441 domain-containing protein [Desulfuribacillus alkaliarsenatis]OEF98272.1 hypothetical protein BHF68_00895 [Desulfuribacillus alkaliarsenatis]
MECIKNEIYYHIQNSNSFNSLTNWSIGQTYFVGKNRNPFFGFFDSYGKGITDPNTSQIFSINYAASAMENYINTGKKDPAFANFYHFDSNRAVSELADTLNHYIRYVREILFEEVRKDFFPGYPSRQRGIWVIPNDCDITQAVNYWWSQLGAGNKKVFKVELTGKIHRSNQQYLTLRTDKLDVFRQEAFKYWVGVSGNTSIEDECLFEGFVTVLEEVNP